MATIQIVKGDSYAIRRPMWTHEFVDTDNEPLAFWGCTILTTYKTAIVPIGDDPDDNTAIIRHGIEFDGSGVPTTENGLYYIAPGIIEERFDSTLTRSLEADQTLMFDIQLEDANGEFFTFVMVDQIVAKDSVTNRFALA